MRYDKEIYFVKEVDEEVYDDATGDYIPSEPLKESRWVSVTDMGVDRMNAIFGRIKKGAVTIRVQGFYEDSYDYILIDEKKYDSGLTRKDRRGTTIEAGDRA